MEGRTQTVQRIFPLSYVAAATPLTNYELTYTLLFPEIIMFKALSSFSLITVIFPYYGKLKFFRKICCTF